MPEALNQYSPLRQQPQKMAWWYWALLDEMIAHPEVTKKDLAAKFNVTPVSIYLITNSDIFQAQLTARRRGLASALDDAIATRGRQVALKSLGLIEKVLDKKQDSIPLEELTDLTDKTLERLGYGVKAGGVTVNSTGQTQVVVPVSLQDLEAARAALRRNEEAKVHAELRPMIDVSNEDQRVGD